ncbi:MAG: ABC transporter ATP-binding protein [Clostridia bacterium]|nr:ABC transporter ATP-binding protein [Clostridia bacterium]
MLKLMKYMTKTEWLQFFVIVGLVVVDVFCSITLPEYMAKIIRQVGENSPVSKIWETGLIMLLIAFCSLLCVCLAGYFSARVSAGLCKTIRKNVYEKVGNFSMKEINKFSTASLITRSTNDITQIQQTYAIGFRLFFTAPIMAIWAIVKIVGSSFQLSLITASFILFLLIFLMTLVVLVFPKFKIMQKRLDKLNLVARENLTGIKVIRAYNAEQKQTEKFKEANKDFFDVNLFLNKTMSLLSPIMSVVMSGLSLTLIWVGSKLIGQGLNVADLMAFTQYSSMLLISFTMLSMMFLILPRANVSAKRIREVLDSKSSIMNGTIKDVEDLGTIEFKNVCFSYPENKEETLKNISFKLNKAETLAIIGSTGSGKSTIINLIMRFYDATKGEILIDGQNIKDLDLKSLYQKIGYSPQKSAIFSGSIKQNIGYGMDENKHQDKILKALKVSQSEEFVSKLENTINHHISQNGNNISGGQKQRLSIARALAKEPEILLFDDSFSALDFTTDQKLRHELKNSYKNATKVIVAQRIGTIMDADQIIVLEDGKIAGCGKHNDLMKNCEIYRELAYSQLSKEELEK